MDRIEIVGMVLLAVVGQVYAEQWTNPRSYLGETWYYFQDGSGVCVNGVSGGRYENTTSLMFDMNQYGFPNTVISIEGFSNEKWTGADFGRLTALSNVRNGAFRGCQSLENVQGLPSTVTNIGAYAFANCKKLSMCNVVHETRKGITRGIKSIREGAFSNCDFTWVTIPSTTVSVGNLAFSGCSRLQYAYVPTTCQISDNAFSNCKSTFRLIRYKPNQVVSFVDRGQTLPDKITANFAVPYGTLPTLSREGYEFVGWRLDGSSIGDLCYALEDHTLTAQWQVNKYKVIFNANGGDGGITNELDYATEIVVPNVSRVGYVFCGWLPEIDATVPASNVTYMAQWQIDQSVITSDARDYGITAYTNAEWVGDSSVSHDGGESLRSGLIDKNQSSWLEATVSGAGRISFWWKVSSEYWGEDIFDYAYLSVDGVPQGTWSNRRLCGVAIGGATDWTNVIFDVVGEGAHVIRWTYCKDEEDDGECGQDCLWLDEFSFTPKVKVAFDVGDGSEGELPDSIHVLAGESIILPTATFSWVDHVFNGWTDGTANYAAGADYVVPETNVTLVAIWIAKRFLTFTLDGGDGEIPITIKDVPNATVTLPGGEGLHKAKHAFIGWSDGTQTYDPGAEYVVTDSSVEFNAVWAANSLVAPTIASADAMTGGTIETASATIEMTADSGTAIYYTLDGTEPTTNSIPYAVPFVADGMEVTIKAFAVKDDYFDSPVAEFAFSRKPYSAAECINAYGKAVSTGNDDTAWGRVLGDAALDGVAALRSGVIGEGGTSSVEMFVDGAGEIGFWWKASCERVIRGQPKDHVAFYVDGVSQCWMGGLTDWSNVVVSVSGEGSHVLKWVYQKDSNGKNENEDCAWLDEVTWTPWNEITTKQTVVPIPYGWLDSYGLLSGSDPEIAAKQPTGKRDGRGRLLTVEDDFIAGTDPTNENDVFSVSISMSNGFPVVEWRPNLNTNGVNRVYTIYGKATLDEEWTTPTNALSHFFKVEVAMPSQNKPDDTTGGNDNIGGDTPGDNGGSGEEPTGDDSGSTENPIPAGYSTNGVSCVTCTGSEWYDLGLPPTLTMKVQIKHSYAGEYEHTGIIGAMPQSNNDISDWRLFIANGPQYRWYLDYPGASGGLGVGSRISGGSTALNTIYEIEFGNFYVKDIPSNAVISVCPLNQKC